VIVGGPTRVIVSLSCGDSLISKLTKRRGEKEGGGPRYIIDRKERTGGAWSER